MRKHRLCADNKRDCEKTIVLSLHCNRKEIKMDNAYFQEFVNKNPLYKKIKYKKSKAEYNK